MKNIRTKLQEVYIPFIIIAIGTILLYNTLRWILDFKLGILPLKDDLLNFWIPFALPWIPVFLWLSKRIKILKVDGKSENKYFFYQFVMVAAIAIPIMVSQNYIEKSSFDLQKISTVSDIGDHKNEKYFKISSFNIDHSSSLPYITARTSGRNNDRLNYYLYFACPFEKNISVWYGVDFQKSIGNRSSDNIKDSEYRSFIKMSERDFNEYDFQNLRYFEKLGYSDDRDGFLEAIKNKYPEINENEQIILVPKTEVFENRLGNLLPWIFGSFGIGSLVVLFMVVIPKIDEKEFKNFKEKRPAKNEELEAILDFLNPKGENKGTAILMVLNILVFIVMVFQGLNIVSPTSQELLGIGGVRRFEVLTGDYWRLFTAMFIHGGILHLLMNLVGLGIGSVLLEYILGSKKLIITYIISGILASIGSIYWHDHTISVGASGAIFGLYGIILAFSVFNIYSKTMRKTTLSLLGIYAGISLILGLFGGIDNAAHITGLISGFIIGGTLILLNKENLILNAR
ncbi:rhomboid family intramembrane serine protease [Gramella sp. GC03-9]|uniref:Rhomboid family intramembrane serine protease n=1 Tax=Christiangramia oceanisediminis TaxID=2920386 RepID=A0A9X2IA56_9FLAO|nr:rhomboid family intramembrane serine protease [Gramella oceanisediminis]MCP9198858.1 rhomboid family intramembrane serine protease [Gramella oceanisediminis]